MGYSYEIQYKSGKENTVADALSRVAGAELLCMALSIFQSDLLDLIQQSWHQDPHVQHILHQIQQGFPIPNYEWVNQQLRRKEKLVVGLNSELRQKLLSWAHASPVAGYSGREATLHKDVSSFVRKCVVCQACKYDNAAYPGLLQPLQILSLIHI